jgi:DNA-binding transcriptional ArsR family regulator
LSKIHKYVYCFGMTAKPLEEKIQALEARVQALEAAAALPHPDASAGADERKAPRHDGALWVLEGLQRRLDAGQGGVVYAGRFNDRAGGELQWQIGRPQQALLDEDWADLAPRLAALGHPTRLRLAQLLLQGMGAVAELAAQPGMGTSGQLYHHLRELESAGWVHSPQRGSYALRPERVVALMAVLTAARQ